MDQFKSVCEKGLCLALSFGVYMLFTVYDSTIAEGPEGFSDNPYRKIALTILACFCTDPELVRTNSELDL